MSDLFEKVGLPPLSRTYLDTVLIYVVLFLTTSVREDVLMLVGSCTDKAWFKTLILFAVLFNAGKDWRIALFWTVVIMIAHWTVNKYQMCKPYVDKTPESKLSANVWVTNFGSPSTHASTGVSPNTFSQATPATYNVVPAK